MNKVFATVTGVIAALVMFTGCSNVTMLRTAELRSIQTRVDSLSVVITGLQNQIIEEQKSQSELLRSLRADQQIRFNEIDRKVVAIDGNISESQVRLSKIDEKTAQVQKKIDAQLVADSLSETSKISEQEKLLQIAMSDFYAGRFDIAVAGFTDIASKNQGSPIAQDAEYWIAECSYAKKEYAEAEKAYMAYLKKYPQGSKSCVVFYKLGLVYEKQNKDKFKQMVWKKLIEQCPDSQEAKVVQAQMAR
ncbi:MAG: tetratricopeptide repeat protein [Fibrobacter sp.]|nr:tetratricopeptide repeat protein [Fibrobacter sp.]